MGGYSGGMGRQVPLNNWSEGVNCIVSPKFVVFVSMLSRLFCVCDSCWGNLQPSHTLLLDLSEPLCREGMATWRGEEGSGRKEREREG